MNKITVLGSGSWATALVKIFCETQTKVGWWMHKEDRLNHIAQKGHNPDYLSAVYFKPNQLELFLDLNESIGASEIIVLAIPSIHIKEAFKWVDKTKWAKKIIFSSVKGLIPKDNLMVHDFLNKEQGVSYKQMGAIMGPCHAEEVAQERLSYLTVAASEILVAKSMSKALNCHYIKTQTSSDVFGTEAAAVLKNIYAIASGIAHGLGYGDNFQAVLISNALREMGLFLEKIFPKKRNIKDTVYLGDLLVTTYSLFSRNRTLGNFLGKGYTAKAAIAEMNMIAEGYYACEGIYKILKNKELKLPIIDCVYEILHEKKTAKTHFSKLAQILI